MRIPVFIVCFLLAACNQSAVSKKLSDCDSVVINFNVADSDEISKTVAATEKTAIRKLAGFMNGKVSEGLKCGYDGNMIFYADGKEILPVVFKYKDKDCRHFLYELDGKLMDTYLNMEAADFMESLEAGRLFY
jgi:hypothetical protein